MKFLLTIWLRDGRVLSGEYDYLVALAREGVAKQLPLYLDSRIERSRS